MSRNFELDRIDHKLLQLLQVNSSRTLEDLGDAIGLSPSAVQRRITKYRSSGLLAKEVAVLNGKYLDNFILAAAFATFDRETPALHKAFKKKVVETPEVQQCYDLAGGHDYLVMIAASSMDQYNSIIEKLFIDDPNIKRYDTFFVFDNVKASLSIPLGDEVTGR